MDNLTHTFTAVALSHAGFNRKTRFATIALILGSNVLDIDIMTRIGGSVTYLKYHRGITHSLVGLTILAALLWGVLYWVARRAAPKKTGPPLDARWLFATCWVAAAIHLLLDFTNHYGVRPFLPFSARWYSWDIMFIADPLLWGLLAAGLGFPAILRLVSEEVGAKNRSLRGGAVFSLSALVALWGVRDVAHRRALSLLDARTYREENPQRLAAFPSPANPFNWVGVVETDSAFHVLSVNALGSDVDPDSPRVFRKPEPSPALTRAIKTRTGVVFSDFARFPWGQVDQMEEGFNVTLRDLRFFSPTSQTGGFVAEIELDKNLQVRSETFSFTGRETKLANRKDK